ASLRVGHFCAVFRRAGGQPSADPGFVIFLQAVAASASDLVVGLGQATVEMIGVGPRSPEPVIELGTFSVQSGGAVGITLATVAALGGRARYFGRLSDDEFGSVIRRGLKEFGVDVSQVLIEPGKVSPASFVMVD